MVKCWHVNRAPFRQRSCSAKDPPLHNGLGGALCPCSTVALPYRKLLATLDPWDVALGDSVIMLRSMANHTASYE